MRESRYWGLGLIWLGAAVTLGATGMAARTPPPLPQLLLAAQIAALVVAYRRGGGFRAWADQLPLRTILAFHLTRFVGIYFLFLYASGELPYAFAVPGGWGDIVSAALALVVMAISDRDETRAPLVWAWNAWGLLAVLLTLVTAARLLLSDPSSMHALLALPLSLLPTFFVPLLIASHLLVFRRLMPAGSRWR